jgi:PPM family protein phosphatase
MDSQARPAPSIAAVIASLSDVGRVRGANEDSFDQFVRDDGARLLVVADGMGGHRGGATASREAVAAIGEIFRAPGPGDPGERLVRAIEHANARVFSLAQEDPSLAGMGTTVVALLVDADGRAAIAHVGDSRAYRFRNRRLEPLTVDHSVVAEMLRRGVLTAEEAAYHPRRNEILRSVGVLPVVEVETSPLEIAPGDWVLLCSDGLCGVVSEAEIDLALANSASPRAAVEALVRLANESGGPDNVTVQIFALTGDDAAAARGAAGLMADTAADSNSPSRHASNDSRPPAGRRRTATPGGARAGSWPRWSCSCSSFAQATGSPASRGDDRGLRRA